MEPNVNSPQPEMPTDERLHSWKEIATYLKRDVTTVQRWEKREAMPVHRHLHDKMGSVFAFRAELSSGRIRLPERSIRRLLNLRETSCRLRCPTTGISWCFFRTETDSRMWGYAGRVGPASQSYARQDSESGESSG